VVGAKVLVTTKERAKHIKPTRLHKVEYRLNPHRKHMIIFHREHPQGTIAWELGKDLMKIQMVQGRGRKAIVPSSLRDTAHLPTC